MFDINKITSVLNFREKASMSDSCEKSNLHPVWNAYIYPSNYGKKVIEHTVTNHSPTLGYYKVFINIYMDTTDKTFKMHYGKEFIKTDDNTVECCDAMLITISCHTISLDIDADFDCWFKGFNRMVYGDYIIYDDQKPRYSQGPEHAIKNIPFPNWSNRFLDRDIRDLIKVLYEIASSPTIHFIPGKGVVGVYGKVDK